MAVVFSVFQVHAQEDTTVDNSKVLLVIFEDKMYRSTIDHTLASAAGISREDLRKKVRKGLDDNLMLEMKGVHKATSVLRTDTSRNHEAMYEIYSGIGYSYEPLEEAKVDDGKKETKFDKIGAKMDNLFAKRKSKADEEQRSGSWVQNGQVVSRIDNREKYMKTVVVDPSLLKRLNQTYGTGKFLFINQLDILTAGSEYDKERKIQVHYTILDVHGNVLASGAESSYFSENLNDLKKIINEEFYHVTNRIAKKL